MAIDARSRVIGQIGAASGVDERKDSDPQGYAQRDEDGDLQPEPGSRHSSRYTLHDLSLVFL